MGSGRLVDPANGVDADGELDHPTSGLVDPFGSSGYVTYPECCIRKPLRHLSRTSGMSAMATSATSPPATSSGLRSRSWASSEETVLAADEVVDEGIVSIVDFPCSTADDSMAL